MQYNRVYICFAVFNNAQVLYNALKTKLYEGSKDVKSKKFYKQYEHNNYSKQVSYRMSGDPSVYVHLYLLLLVLIMIFYLHFFCLQNHIMAILPELFVVECIIVKVNVNIVNKLISVCFFSVTVKSHPLVITSWNNAGIRQKY